jgi:hypothetical protein
MRISALVLGSLLIVGGGARAASTTYDVDLTIGTGTIVGAITTNGALGELSTADFTKWSLALTDTAIAGLPQTLTQANSALTFLSQSGAAISATPDMQASRSTITWNFGSHDGDLFAFQLNGKQSGDAGFCGANAGSVTCDSEPDPALTIGNPNATTKADFVTETGIVKLGTVAAPEIDPASTASALTLLLAGLAVVGGRKRHGYTPSRAISDTDAS